ncbi:MAG: hypothetical protein ACOH1N_14655 [Lutibacter sp.]
MSQDSDYKSKLLQINNDKGYLSKITIPHLKLVVSNPEPLQVTSLSQEIETNRNIFSSFTTNVRVKGPCLYEMALQDLSHYLACDLILDVEENNEEYEGKTVFCHFPTLSDEGLNNFVAEDQSLCDIIMVQFQMKILEQLLLFCATHNASSLVIFADDVQADDLGVYQDFLTYEDQTFTSKGEKTEMVIPADRETFDAWIDFMDQTNGKFKQSLWRDQKTNPIIRQYLKMHCVVPPHESQESHNI